MSHYHRSFSSDIMAVTGLMKEARAGVCMNTLLPYAEEMHACYANKHPATMSLAKKSATKSATKASGSFLLCVSTYSLKAKKQSDKERLTQR